MKTKLIKLHKHYQEKTNELGEMLDKADAVLRDGMDDYNGVMRSQLELGYTEFGLLYQFTKDLENLIC